MSILDIFRIKKDREEEVRRVKEAQVEHDKIRRRGNALLVEAVIEVIAFQICLTAATHLKEGGIKAYVRKSKIYTERSQEPNSMLTLCIKHDGKYHDLIYEGSQDSATIEFRLQVNYFIPREEKAQLFTFRSLKGDVIQSHVDAFVDTVLLHLNDAKV